MLSFLCQKQVTLTTVIMRLKNVISCDSRLRKIAKVLKKSSEIFDENDQGHHLGEFFKKMYSKFTVITDFNKSQCDVTGIF